MYVASHGARFVRLGLTFGVHAVVGSDGSFSVYDYSGGGDAKRVSYSRFIKDDAHDDDEM